MTQQELIEQNVRLILGDLQLQLVIARARTTELEEQVAALEAQVTAAVVSDPPGEEPQFKPNGSRRPPEATKQ